MNTKHRLLYTAALMATVSLSATAAQQSVNLGTAADFAILSKAGISTTGTTAIVGDIGVSPIDSTAITGFTLTLDATEAFATSPFITGKAYASDFVAPTPSQMTTVIGDLEIAYADAAGRIDGNAVTELGAGNISGMTLAPGLYKWGTGLLINTNVTLSGDPCGVWIFQIAEDLTVTDGVNIILSGGATSANIFWQVGGEATVGTTSHMEGIILSKTAIHMRTGSSINGALLAQTAVTLDASSVTIPSSIVDTEMVWFGSFNGEYLDSGTGNGWIYHSEHGWLYTIQSPSGLWLWDTIQQTWLWTSPCNYSFFYNNNEAYWVYYELDGTPDGRWFYFFNKLDPNLGEWRWID